MSDDKRAGNHKHKACPFRKDHYCPHCELLMPGIDKCIFVCLNLNFGLLVKVMMNDPEGIKKILEDMKKKKEAAPAPVASAPTEQTVNADDL